MRGASARIPGSRIVSPSGRFAGICGCLLAAGGVVCGAFGAHALRGTLTADSMATWLTAVHYQFLHAIGLILVAAFAGDRPGIATKFAIGGFVGGTLLFSGSLYALAVGAPTAFGMATPLGGLAFILGWIALACSIVRSDPQ
jgi:uncharacterized membrane protein YgdD (TMEM256/DUF423 family)